MPFREITSPEIPDPLRKNRVMKSRGSYFWLVYLGAVLVVVPGLFLLVDYLVVTEKEQIRRNVYAAMKGVEKGRVDQVLDQVSDPILLEGVSSGLPAVSGRNEAELSARDLQQALDQLHRYYEIGENTIEGFSISQEDDSAEVSLTVNTGIQEARNQSLPRPISVTSKWQLVVEKQKDNSWKITKMIMKERPGGS